MDDRIYDEKELQKLLPVAVISEIPAIRAASDERRERRAIVDRMGDGGFRICYDFGRVRDQLLARLAIRQCISPSTA